MSEGCIVFTCVELMSHYFDLTLMIQKDWSNFETSQYSLGKCRYPWNGGPLIITPIYTLFIPGIHWVYRHIGISPFKRLQHGSYEISGLPVTFSDPNARVSWVGSVRFFNL